MNRGSDLSILKAISYELKLPVAHIVHSSKMIQDGVFDASELAEQVKRIQLRGERVLNLLESMHFAGKVAEDQLHLDLAPVNVAAVVANATKESQPLAARYGREIDLVTTKSLHPASANEEALFHATYSIMDNVLRSSRSEVVEVNIHNHLDEVMITMRDEGDNITPGVVESIMRDVGKMAQPQAHVPGSSGLSVYICKSLTDAMQGRFITQKIKHKRMVSLVFPKSTQLSLTI